MRFKILLLSHLIVAVLAASVAYDHAPVKIKEHLVMVETQKPIFLPYVHNAKTQHTIDVLAAAIPVKALRAAR